MVSSSKYCLSMIKLIMLLINCLGSRSSNRAAASFTKPTTFQAVAKKVMILRQQQQQQQQQQTRRKHGILNTVVTGSRSQANRNQYSINHQHPYSYRFLTTTSLCAQQAQQVSVVPTIPEEDEDTTSTNEDELKLVTLSTITQDELETLVVTWGFPKYRAQQIWTWLRQGVVTPSMMNNVPKKLREQLETYSKPYSLQLVFEAISKDGTIKRAYQCHDGQVIESVLMPYDNKKSKKKQNQNNNKNNSNSNSQTARKYTACISSQAGCAQGCVFCATGQMGFARQLTAAEIVEQVARFQDYLATTTTEEASAAATSLSPPPRLSNIVFMGMGEPLANYRQVKIALDRLTTDYGIGARKITVSTVGIVNNILKLGHDFPQIRLAVSLHCATDAERTALLPANARNGGLDTLFSTLKTYMEEEQTTGGRCRRITFEWALIHGQNDDLETAQALVKLITNSRHKLRRDMIHVNVIPLNPTEGFQGAKASQRDSVNAFCQYLEQHGIACTPRMRRGIDIDAGCGQLKASVLRKQQQEQQQEKQQQGSMNEKKEEFQEFIFPKQGVNRAVVGVYEDDYDEEEDDRMVVDGEQTEWVVDYDNNDDGSEDSSSSLLQIDSAEADRLLLLVKDSVIDLSHVKSEDDEG